MPSDHVRDDAVPPAPSSESVSGQGGRPPRVKQPPRSLVPSNRPFSLVRSFVLADLITVANAACGTGAVLGSMSYVASGDRGTLVLAFVLLPLALLCDALDGAVARWRQRSSVLGADLDSLADIVSFGVAPVALGHALGLRGAWDAIIFCIFVACGIARLARYNVTAESLADERGKVKHYEGTPIPTSLVLVVVLAVAFRADRIGPALWGGHLEIGPWVLHPLALMYLVSGALMASTIKVPKP